jgi:hypothetical protein
MNLFEIHVTNPTQKKEQQRKDRWNMLCMVRDIDTLPLLKLPNSTTLSESDNTSLGDNDDHQGETKQKVLIQSIMIPYPIQPMITISMPKT